MPSVPYRVQIATRRVERQLRAAAQHDRATFSRIRAAVEALASDPRPPGCIKLAGEAHLYRIRVGGWRVIFRIDDAAGEIVIAKVARRSEGTYT